MADQSSDREVAERSSAPTRRKRGTDVVAAKRVGSRLVDLTDPEASASNSEDVFLSEPAGLDVLRRTVAEQVLGRALKTLFADVRLGEAQITEDGFYYDVLVDAGLSADDLPRLESKMRSIIQEGAALRRFQASRIDVVSRLESGGESFKLELVQESNSPEVTLYEQVDTGFVQISEGPLLASLAWINQDSFALTSVSGAYWRGDSNNPMLTRISGTAWQDSKALHLHIERLEEARRRDHRTLANKMDLFHFSPASPGQVFWHSAGWTMYQELTGLIREKLRQYNYEEINTPRLVSKSLYEQSGHWEKFGTGNMFTTEGYGETYALKPMNCPSHILVYNDAPHSYRDLPVRFAEFGNCFRRELSGTLHGLMRVTSMTQDDAHVFCTMAQVQEEILILNDMIKDIYGILGFSNYYVRFSDRPELRIGDDATWDRAESALLEACAEAGIETVLNPGEGAFYGPKLEYVLTDSIGRDWQCGTIQLDFNLPDRLDASYTTPEGTSERPVMIHRAIIGTVERFMGIFLEQHAFSLPLWISPTQIVFSAISDSQASFAQELADKFRGSGIRASFDRDQSERISNRVRQHSEKRIPLIAVVGEREITEGTVSLRVLGTRETVPVSVDDLLERMTSHIADRELSVATLL